MVIMVMEMRDMEALEVAMLTLIDCLLRVELKNNDFENVVTSGLAVVAINSDGAWHSAASYGPNEVTFLFGLSCLRALMMAMVPGFGTLGAGALPWWLGVSEGMCGK